MKQHMLTHKIRDMPHHLFADSKPPPPPPPLPTPPLAPSSRPSSQPSYHHPSPIPQQQHSHPREHQQQRQSVTPVPTPMHQDLEKSRSPICPDELSLPPPLLPPSSQQSPIDISAKKEAEAKKSPGKSVFFVFFFNFCESRSD